MPYIPLKLPPGLMRNGTKYQAKGRWYDADLVRWNSGAMMAVGGWQKVMTTTGGTADIDLSAVIRGALAWRANSQKPWLALGTNAKAYSFSEGVLDEITPASGYTAGGADATLTVSNYGNALYSGFAYGEGDPAQGTLVEANSWQFDSFGQKLIACCYSDGKILSYNLTGDLAVVDASAPTSCKAVVVTPERFVVALGAGGDGRKVQWSDQEDETTWTAAEGNDAGDFILPGAGQLMCGRRARNETLLWTDHDIFAMRWIGGTLVYTFAPLGANCGIISRQAVALVEGKAIWMSHRGFYLYDGFVQPIPCEISDYIFSDINKTQRSKIAAIPFSEWGEVWFCYPSAGSTENDRIAIYNYVEGHFSLAQLSRTGGVDRGAFEYPMLTDATGAVYDHERGDGFVDTDDSTTLVPSAESGPIEIARGDQIMMIRGIVPDDKTLGDVSAELYAALYPDATETSQTGITLANPTSVRLSGRQVRLKIIQVNVGWRVGVPRLNVVPGGLR